MRRNVDACFFIYIISNRETPQQWRCKSIVSNHKQSFLIHPILTPIFTPRLHPQHTHHTHHKQHAVVQQIPKWRQAERFYDVVTEPEGRHIE